jgi:hypothetical protein
MTQAFFVTDARHIASWVTHLDEQVDMKQAFHDWSIVQDRPDEFTEDILDNIVIAILNRFCLPSYNDLEFMYNKWRATGVID